VRQWIGRFCNSVFSGSATRADAATANLLTTLKRFSCSGAVDWSTPYFCYESVLQKPWQFCDRSAWISKSSGFIAIVLFHQSMPSRLGCKTVRTPENAAVVRGHWKNSTQFCASPPCVTRAVWSQRSTDFTLRSSLLPLQNSSYSCTTGPLPNQIKQCCKIAPFTDAPCIIFQSTSRSSKGSLSLRFPAKTLEAPLFYPQCYMLHPPHCEHPNNIWWGV
jgi:hypothetical protein